MTTKTSSVANLIGDIYQAAYEPSNWPSVVEELRQMFSGSQACIARIGPDLQPSDAITANTDPAFQVLFAAEYWREATVLQRAVEATPVGSIYRDHALIGSTLRKSRFWNEWMAPQDMYNGVASKVLTSGSSFWIVDVQKGRNQADFSAADLKKFRAIAPHMRRAVEIGRRIQTTTVLGSAFSLLPVGIALVDRDRRVLTINDTAERLLSRRVNSLAIRGGQLVVLDVDKAALLERLIIDACRAVDGAGHGFGGDVLLGGPRFAQTAAVLSVSVGPMCRGTELFMAIERCAVVFIREMTFGVMTAQVKFLRETFRLTQREAEIAMFLTSGHSLKHAAELSGIHFSTARTHLEHIFSKTRTHQQSQLVAMLQSMRIGPGTSWAEVGEPM